MTAIYFQPEGYSTTGKKLMGRHAAGESFLRAYLRYSGLPRYRLLVDDGRHVEAFRGVARALGCDGPVDVIESRNPEMLAQAGNAYFPGPGLAPHAWLRSLHGHDRWSLCGVTHTTSSAGAMDSITELIVAPVQPWDALICTSRAVKRHVENLLAAQVEYLKGRLGLSRVLLPLLPVIPLGIHCSDFGGLDRDAARRELGIGPRDHVVLFVGRLSFHAKAHPLAMYRALELAAADLPSDERIVLVECGWFANEGIERAFEEGAAILCPSVQVVRVDGRNAENRRRAWGCADVFCSLADNIQETFGIVPIEAMAAGLPVVVSDWDGYRDTVQEGVEGFRIPTAMPGPGNGGDLARRHASGRDSYDMYCGLSCSLVSVDIGVAANRFTALFRSPELRRRMGRAGRDRARTTYDWSIVMKQYLSLWQEQGNLRRFGGGPAGDETVPWPARMDPFRSFSHYPSQQLVATTLLALADGGVEDARVRAGICLGLSMVRFAGYVLPGQEFINGVLNRLGEDGQQPAGRLAVLADSGSVGAGLRGLAWMLKVGLIRIVGRAGK